MSMWRPRGRPAPEARSTVTIPSYVFGQQYSTGSYANVDTSSMTAPLQSVAAGSTIDLICSLSSGLPVGVFSGTGQDQRRRATPGYLEDPSGEGYGLPDWSYQALMSYLCRGNLYGNVAQEGPGGVPQQVILMSPDTVRPQDSPAGGVEWFVSGKKFAGRLWHTRINPVPGQLLGLSPISHKARTLGVSLRASAFGDQWFTDGAHPSGMLRNTESDLSGKDQAQTVKDRFMAALYGSREPLVLGRGWEWQQLQVSADESQFLQTLGWSEAQCARIFGPGYAEVLGYDSGGSLTYATVEGRATHLLVFSLSRWLNVLEALLTAMLPRPQYAKLNRAALLETTVIERYRAHELALRNGWKTPDEVRATEDMPPLPDSLGAVPNKPSAGAPPAQDTGAPA